MSGGRSYSSTTRRTTTTADPGTSGTTLTVADSTVFSPLDGDFPWTALINWGLSDQEIVNVTARPSGTTLTVQRGQDGTSGVAHTSGATVDHGVSARDFNQVAQLPGACQALGHSYFAVSGATFYQTGRADMQLHSALGIGYESWKNRAVSGSMLAVEGRSQGGWGRVMQEVTTGQRNAPYVSDIGASVLCWGINDIGKIAATQAQINTMFGNALRAVVSRCRAAVVFDDGFSVGTTSATITCTLPSDYAGETVALQFVVAAAAGGSITLSGTAGATGTISLSSVVPSGAGTHVPVVKRITNLTSSNAGQTIVATVTAVTTSVLFDAWWLESQTPPPVIVSNCARVLSAGYAIYANTIGDSDVATLNTTIAGIVAEFDQMVRLADIDTAIGKDAQNLAADGLHPNERGASLMVSAYMDAFRAMVPTAETNQTANFNASSMRWGVPRKTRLPGQYYSVDAAESWITANPVAGQMWAAPFWVHNPREWYNRIATRLTSGGSTAGTIRWGIYDDPDLRGYPKALVFEATSAGAMSLGTTPGIVQNPTSGAGSISWTPDPGLYWLVYKQITQGTNQSVLCLQGPDRWGVMPQLDPSTLAPLSTPIAYVLGGQGATALPNTYPLGAGIDYVFPVMALMAANTGP
jgi:lysophospholipase L1-like esterase